MKTPRDCVLEEWSKLIDASVERHSEKMIRDGLNPTPLAARIAENNPEPAIFAGFLSRLSAVLRRTNG